MRARLAGFSAMELIVVIALLALLAVFIGGRGCTDNESAARVLSSQGYREIRLTGYELLGCGQGDTTRTGFRAVGVNGARVEGVVCCGFTGCGKACTVRVR